jgi:predicted transcriptional regulator
MGGPVSGRVRDPGRPAKIAELCEAGAPASEIGRRLGISQQAVYQNLRTLEREGRGTARNPRRKRPPKRD